MFEVRKSTKRNANIELLRIISMLMVTMLHALGKGRLLGSLTDGSTANTWIAWIFESLSIPAVNIFMLISGYFLVKSSFRLSRLIEIIAQIIFYTAGSFVFFYFLGIVSADEINRYWFLNYFLPIHMDVYGFMNIYIVLYTLLPIISRGIHNIEKKELATVIIILLIFDCVFKSVLPFRLYADSQGTTFLWNFIVFLIGSYFRLYGFRILKSPVKGWILYFVSCFMIFLELAVLQYVNNVLGHLEEIGGVTMEYNHIFVLAAATGIFAAFIQHKPMEQKAGKIICFLSPMALGVYLFQESMTLRFRWQPWFKLYDAAGEPLYVFLTRVFGAVFGMFLLGIGIDYVRMQLFAVTKKAICKWKK